MSANVARQAPAKSETKRSKRLLTSNTRKSRQQREDIENTHTPVTLANLPIQKQSTQIRKRLLTECQSNAALTPGDRSSNKRQKLLLDDPRSDSAVALSVPPLHRTLSDKSSYLNQAPLHELSPDAKSHMTSAVWKRASQLRRTTSDSDADADDEDDPQQRLTSPTAKLQALSQTSAKFVKSNLDALSTPFKNDPQPTLAGPALTQSPSHPNTQALLSVDDELFGSDTTLTSPEDDSDDDLTSPLRPSTKVKRTRSTKREVPFSIRTRSKRVSSTDTISQSNTEPNRSDPCPASANDASVFHQIQSLVDSPAPDLVVQPVVSIAPMSLMARILENRKGLTGAELDQDDADSDDGAQPGMSTLMAPLCLKRELSIAPVASEDILLNATVMESLLKDIYTAVCPSNSEQSPSAPATPVVTTQTEDHIFAKPALPALRSNHSHTSSRARSFKLEDIYDRPNTRQFASRQSTRTMPRPRLFQTCADIMSRSDPDRHRTNIQSLSLVLKHSLEQGMRKIQGATAQLQDKAEEHATELKVMSVNMLAWGAVIGNGKGLFRESPSRQREMERISERRNIVDETYRALDFPPPPHGWDKSSLVILDNLRPVKARNGKTDKRWPSDLDNTLGCDYCRKTFQDQAGLAHHMERCPMAQLQTSIATDLDGDSTASETEDQRMARSPTTLLEKKAGIKDLEEISENDDEEDEEEGGDEEGIIMCICGSKEDEGAMVQCDKCEVWLHLECLDLAEDDVPEEYFCPTCQGLPTPSTGGKSFRHIPTKASEKTRSQTKAGRPHRQAAENQETVSAKGSRRVSRPKPAPHWMHVRQDAKTETGSDTEDIYSTGTDEDESQHDQEALGSPQVTLNHDWRSVGQGSGSILGYDSEYMSTLFGGPSTQAVFKKSRAPALMLDGSSSQEVQEELTNNALPTDLGFNDHDDVIFPGAANRHAIMGTGFGSDGLFDQGYIGSDGINSSQNLGSDDTVDSDGLRTPVDLWRDTDQSDQWVSNNFGEIVSENVQDFGLESGSAISAEYKSSAVTVEMDHYPELLTNNVIDWYCDQDQLRADNFDIDGLIDLEAVSTPEEK